MTLPDYNAVLSVLARFAESGIFVADLDSQRKLGVDAVRGLGVLLGRHFAVLLPTMLLVRSFGVARFIESRARISHVLAKLELLGLMPRCAGIQLAPKLRRGWSSRRIFCPGGSYSSYTPASKPLQYLRCEHCFPFHLATGDIYTFGLFNIYAEDDGRHPNRQCSFSRTNFCSAAQASSFVSA